ncbi:MAG: VCBS repeat-containing protein, partial [Verrucomicrobiales bacterium]|nr:VCBS repeat-containing protein [Verrucomicrobiales bacterium]
GAGLLAYDRGGAANAVLPLGADTLGPLAVADFDADGDLDLFVGGGPVGGRYPEPSPSRLYERIGTEWRPAAEPDPALLAPGLVSGAVWTDLDADGFPELVLACEWGPVRIFANTRGKLREATAEWGTAARTGWWTGVASADFDGDGRLDLAVGNWGLNSRYRPTPEHPIRLYYGDLAGQGQVELIEASHVPELGGWAPERDLDLMSRQLPWLRALFPTHAAYARSTVEACLADRAASPRVLNATTLASVVLLNRGHAFELVPLPDEAQYAPVFGINAADFDLDGHVDLFLAQNFFPVSTAVSGQDAGLGLLLLGDGRGRFRPQSAERSGIRIFGEQRGSAVADFDGDGRPDLAVAQNGAETRLLRNRAPNEGLAIRVRMDGPNPDGIGVVVRPIDPARPAAAGPAQELRAGSGYRSQDSPTLYLPRPRGPLAVEVRRPGGATHRIDIPDAATSAQTILRLPAARP